MRPTELPGGAGAQIDAGLTISLMRLGGVPQSIYRRHPRKLERDHGDVRTVMGDDHPLPAAIERGVFHLAVELGRQVASDDLFLLALTRLGPDSPARQALDAAGVTAGVLLANIRAGGDGVPASGDGLTYSPAYYGMRGRAEAFAAALGD
ncbi:MAG TPA: hypothetical protein VNT52_04740, partial [Acidimicrobiales bacterium]|nr:hypothetical protein [Acidimicrobiales bacterium]